MTVLKFAAILKSENNSQMLTTQLPIENNKFLKQYSKKYIARGRLRENTT